MSGFTKHMFEEDIKCILEMWNKEIRVISDLLPQYYDVDDIIALLQQYFPHEWKSVEYKYEYYQDKDRYLKKRFGKARYNMDKPTDLLKKSNKYKEISSKTFKQNHSNAFSEETMMASRKALMEKRKAKIERIDQKIEKSLFKTQQVTPTFIDQLIGFYERKRTTQKDKVYILLELKKYYNPKVIKFFFKLNDTELNKQLRYDAFQHLQSFNYQPRLRKQKYMQIHTKNKKRKDFLKNDYPNQTYTIPKNPNELEYRIENSKEQKIKRYDFFLSHSYIDGPYVQNLIFYLNKQGKNVFCDWICDSDYLKRKLLCNATLKVIEERLFQSDSLVFVESDNSYKSKWCKYELNYFYNLNKPIYIISVHDIEKCIFEMKELNDDWFIDSDYKRLISLNT